MVKKRSEISYFYPPWQTQKQIIEANSYSSSCKTMLILTAFQVKDLSTAWPREKLLKKNKKLHTAPVKMSCIYTAFWLVLFFSPNNTYSAPWPYSSTERTCSMNLPMTTLKYFLINSSQFKAHPCVRTRLFFPSQCITLHIPPSNFMIFFQSTD